MKKPIFVLLSMFLAVSASAQFHFGGQFNINFGKEQTTFKDGTSIDKENAYMLSLQPKLYWNLNEKMQLGTRVGFVFGRLKTGTVYNTEKEESQSMVNRALGWSVSPFYGYRVLTWKRVSAWAEANAFFGQCYNVGKGTAPVTEWNRQSEYGFQILPVIDIALKEKLALQLHLGFISLGYYGTRSTYRDKTVTTSTWDLHKGGFSGVAQGLLDYGIGLVKQF